MQLRKLLAATAAAIWFTAGAMAQTDTSATSQPDSTSKSTSISSKKKKRSSKKSSSKSSKSSKSAKRSKKKKSGSASKKSVTTELQAQGPIDDGEAPQLSHQPIEAGTRGKA